MPSESRSSFHLTKRVRNLGRFHPLHRNCGLKRGLMGSKDKTKRHEVEDGEGYYPYQPGTILKVDFWPESNAARQGKKASHQDSTKFIELTVVKTFSTTLSCVLLVRLDLEGLDDKSRVAFAANGMCWHDNHESRTEMSVVLKLYDRRFSDGIREDYGAAPWTPKIEEDWKKFKALDEKGETEACVERENKPWLYRSSGEEDDKTKEGDRKFSGREKHKRKTKPESSLEKTDATASGGRLGQTTSGQSTSSRPGHLEADMQTVCDKSFSAELSIYQHLMPAQGRSVPFVYGTVRLSTGDEAVDKINGVMMEYIHPSFTLRGIPENVPDKDMWQEIGETAVRLVQDMGDCGVLNEDVRLDNILVVPVKEGYYESKEGDEPDNNSDKSKKVRFFKVVMIDFGLGHLRGEDETDEDWKKARHFTDEEGAVGFVLEKLLQTAAESKWEARPFKFRHSYRLKCDEEEEI